MYATHNLHDGFIQASKHFLLASVHWDMAIRDWSLTQLVVILQTTFHIYFRDLECSVNKISNIQFNSNFARLYYWRSNWQQISIASGNGLALIKRQGITSINVWLSVLMPSGGATHNELTYSGVAKHSLGCLRNCAILLAKVIVFQGKLQQE